MKVPVFVENEMEWEMRVGVYRDWLSLIHKPRVIGSCNCNVWVMEEYGAAESWTKRFTINLNGIELWRPSYFRENGEIFLVESDGYLHRRSGSGGDFLCYDPKSKQIKNVEGKTCVSYVGTYMESLGLIESLNRVSWTHQNFGGVVTSEEASLLSKEKGEEKANEREENEDTMLEQGCG